LYKVHEGCRGINPNEKSLRIKFPMFSDQIRSYTAMHKLNYKSDDDLILLFSNLNWDALNKKYALSTKDFSRDQDSQVL
jgi:hypothetical protein